MVYYCSSKEGHPEDCKGMCIAYSSDGIHWTPYPDEYQPIWPFGSDTSNNPLWDAKNGRYMYYLRLGTLLNRWLEPEPEYLPGGVRTAGWASSEDFLHWDAPSRYGPWAGEEMKAGPEDKYVCFHPDEKDPRFSRHFYTLSVLPYAGGYVGFTSVYHTLDGVGMRIPAGMDSGKAQNSWLDKIDVQLVWSRDGKKFERVSRHPFIANGPEGS